MAKKITPNPKCASCNNHHAVLIDGYYPGPAGSHHTCVISDDPFELQGNTYIPLSLHVEYIIDGFEKMHGECEFYDSER